MARLAKVAEKYRGLKLLAPVKVRRMDRAELGGWLRKEIAAEPSVGPRITDIYRLLGVIGPKERLDRLMVDILGDQILGAYDDEARELILIRAKGAEASRGTVIHEIVHAIQDQHFNLRGKKIRPGEREGDAETAARALVEGDASEAEERERADRGPGAALGELLGALGQASSGKGTEIPPFIERGSVWPYEAGLAFNQELRKRGGQKLVDRAYRNPPKTTAAVLDVDRYLNGNPGPESSPLPAPARGEKRRFETTLGAADVFALTGKRSLAADWLGGRLALDAAGTRRALVLRIRTKNAEGFAMGLREALPKKAKVTTTGRFVAVRIVGTA